MLGNVGLEKAGKFSFERHGVRADLPEKGNKIFADWPCNPWRKGQRTLHAVIQWRKRTCGLNGVRSVVE